MKNLKLTALFLLINLAQAISAEIPFSIYHTNDLHSHLDGVAVKTMDGYERRGGYARLTTLINSLREKKDKAGEIIMGIDAGDFFAGTIYSGLALGPTKAFPELQFFKENKFDVVTLGNHEFDGQNKGLEILFNKAEKSYSSVPLVSSNIFVRNNSPLQKFIGADKLIKPWLVKDFTSKKGNIRVAFLGALGPDGCLVSRSTRGDVGFVGFDDDHSNEELSDLAKHLNSLIKEMRDKQKADVVILTIHGGSDEAVKLAKKLKGLDVFIAGHTHKVEFAIINDIIINQTGSYGENLGFLELSFDNQKKKVKLLYPEKSPIIKITDSIEPNPTWKKRIDQWRKEAFKLMGHKKELPSEVVFTPRKDYIRSHAIPNPMGKFVTDGILKELNQDMPFDRVDVYMTSMGLVRTSLYKGVPYTRAEIFEVVSIGFDDQFKPGVDIVEFYLSTKDLDRILNFMELYSHISTSFSPAISSSLTFKIRKWGIPFINRIHDVKLNGVELKKVDRLVKIATNRYIINNIETVKKITRGWIEIVPKNDKGEPLNVLSTFGKEYQQLTEHLIKHGKMY
jgi:2',3'-cyclic-nucleotide 2'-phosphodiesterase (5'-nucleotidase family)